MAEAEFAAARIEGLRTVAPAVVGEYAPDGDAESTVVVDGGGEESSSRVASLIGVELGERDARVVVDTDVDVFPSRALAAMLPVAVDALVVGVVGDHFLHEVACLRVRNAVDEEVLAQCAGGIPPVTGVVFAGVVGSDCR